MSEQVVTTETLRGIGILASSALTGIMLGLIVVVLAKITKMAWTNHKQQQQQQQKEK